MDWKAIVIAVVIALVVIAGFFWYESSRNVPAPSTAPGNAFANIAPSVPAATSGPAQTAHDFYAWYLHGLAGNQHFTASQAFATQAGSWLDPSFSASLPRIAAESGSDPLLLSQDFGSDWANSVTANVISQTATDSSVSVRLGGGSTSDSLKVTLTHSDGAWRITAVGPGA